MITELFAFYLYLTGNYILSGCILTAAGIAGTVLGLFGFEFMILIGLLPISIGCQQRALVILVSVLLMAVCTYDLIQWIPLLNQNKDRPLSQSEWLARFQEKEILHRLIIKIIPWHK